MTTNDTTSTTPSAGQEPPQGAPGTPGATPTPPGAPAPPETATQQPGDTEGKAPNTEAARYRVRAREAETERDTLQAELDAMKRSQLEQIAARHLAVPADLAALGGANLADLLDDDGKVDAGKVETAARELLAARPGLAAAPPADRVRDAVHEQYADNPKMTGALRHFDTLAGFLDTSQFLAEDGSVDPDRLAAFGDAMRLAAVWPEMGGGQRGPLGGNGLGGWAGVLKPGK